NGPAATSCWASGFCPGCGAASRTTAGGGLSPRTPPRATERINVCEPVKTLAAGPGTRPPLKKRLHGMLPAKEAHVNGRAITPAVIAQWLRVFFGPGDVVELRALHVERRPGWSQTESGYYDYDHLEDMARTALDLERHAVGVYYTLNPL